MRERIQRNRYSNWRDRLQSGTWRLSHNDGDWNAALHSQAQSRILQWKKSVNWLTTQLNMMVIVLRNLHVERDLCNGTRLKVTIDLSKYYIIWVWFRWQLCTMTSSSVNMWKEEGRDALSSSAEASWLQLKETLRSPVTPDGSSPYALPIVSR